MSVVDVDDYDDDDKVSAAALEGLQVVVERIVLGVHQVHVSLAAHGAEDEGLPGPFILIYYVWVSFWLRMMVIW